MVKFTLWRRRKVWLEEKEAEVMYWERNLIETDKRRTPIERGKKVS